MKGKEEYVGMQLYIFICNINDMSYDFVNFIKDIKKISIKKGSALCEFSVYELFLINDCLNDREAGFALDIEDLHDEFMLTGSDNKDCVEVYNCYDEVSKLKNKVYYYMDQISKSE